MHQNFRLGLSNASASPLLNGFSYGNGTGYLTPPFGAGNGSIDPRASINAAIASTRLETFVFPPDLPKYHFTIIEADTNLLSSIATGSLTSAVGAIWETITNFGRIGLTAQKRYKLPLPVPLVDSFEVDYEQNYSYTSAAARAAAAGGSSTDRSRTAAGVGREAAQAAGAGVGITLNQFKTVTMNSPKFREFKFTWKLAPKNFEEARTAQRIAYNLRKGMTPRTLAEFKALLFFPKIYLMYFSPNIQYMYKFKPCVLKELTVSYTGGEAIPAFYRPEQNVEKESPPESLLLTTTWLELEYWIDKDYKDDPANTGLPSNEPFDAFNLYNLTPANTAPTTP